jgi:hypothetical protein
LNFSARVDEAYCTPAARAEAELALWLAQPAQLGIPPTRLELIDSRTQYWPGFDEPVDCFLFRFAYEFADARFANIGIAGPLTHTFAADLADLPPDDIYAAFAGWHARHEEIYEVDVATLDDRQRVAATRLERRLNDAGYEQIRALQLGFFLGDRFLVARAVLDDRPGIAVVDQQSVLWYPASGRVRPIGPHEASSIYKGRKLLRAFNPEDSPRPYSH